MSIQSLRLKDSSVDLKISALKGLVASHIGKINGKITHLVDPDYMKENLSPFDLKGELNGHAPIQLNGGVNIVNPDIPFDVNAGIGNFRLASTNAVATEKRGFRSALSRIV